jgi:hypothetical protein
MSDAGIPEEIREAIEAERKLEELQTAVARSRALQLEAWLARRSPGVVVIVGILVLALIGLADAASGEFAIEVFYLVPIGLVTFGRGKGMGLLVSLAAAVTWEAVEVFQGVTSSGGLVTYWNGLTRFLGYAAVALLIAPIREAMVLQRQLAEREAEAVEQMRVMEELREAALHSDLTEAVTEEDELTVTDAIEIPGAVDEKASPDAVAREPDADPDPEAQDRLLRALSDLERDARRERRTRSDA